MCVRPKLETSGPRRPWKSLEDIIAVKKSLRVGYNSEEILGDVSTCG